MYQFTNKSIDTELIINKANNYYMRGNFTNAIKAYKNALKFHPNSSQIYTNMGNAFCEIGNLSAAMQSHQNAISINPNYAVAYNNLGNVLYKQGKLYEAVDACKKSISIKPDYAQAYNNMANILKYLGKIDLSIEAFDKAVSLQSSNSLFQLDHSFALLNKGIVKEGLEKYEWRWKTPKFLSQKRDFFQPKWDGKKSLKDKKILIWSEQGIGDTIRWSSVLPLVTSIAKSCILECQEKLVPLLKRSFPNVDVKAVDISNDLERTDFDFHLPMGSLYKCFLDEITKTPKPNSYLKADPDRVSFWRDRLNEVGKSPFYGISWKSSNMEPSRLKNYAPINEWSNLLKLPDTTFVNLQYKDFENDLKDIHDQFGVMVHNFDDLDHYNDIDDVAALCSALDAVISHNNTVHLISGAVGTETKLANWRQSSWNNFLFSPTTSVVDIFEKNTDEKWENIFSLIAKDLSKFNIN